jgi:hypothetical protein
MNVIIRPLPSLAAQWNRLASMSVAAIAAGLLAGCVVAPPPGPILSRLAPGQPGAADSARPLSDAEKKRYDEIDKQVLRDQDEAATASAWARYYQPYYYPAPVTFGTYYGGWNSGWGVGYASPGYYPGWWW